MADESCLFTIGKAIGKWETHRKTIRKLWENGDLRSGQRLQFAMKGSTLFFMGKLTKVRLGRGFNNYVTNYQRVS